MDRTIRAAGLAAAIVTVTVTGLGLFLGFAGAGPFVVGTVLGLLAGLLLWGAARRADQFHPTDPNAHLADHQPSDPAADERPDETNRGA